VNSGHFCKTVVTELEYSLFLLFFDNKKTFIGIWNYSNNRPNIETYALCTFTFSLQTFTIFFLINAFINVYYDFFDVYQIITSMLTAGYKLFAQSLTTHSTSMAQLIPSELASISMIQSARTKQSSSVLKDR